MINYTEYDDTPFTMIKDSTGKVWVKASGNISPHLPKGSYTLYLARNPAPYIMKSTFTPKKYVPYVQKANSKKTSNNTAPSKPSKVKARSTEKKQIKVTFTKGKNAAGTQIQYSNSKKFKKAKSKKTTKKSIVLKSLKSKKTYYIRVRSYRKVNDKTKYSKWVTLKAVKVK